MIHHVLIGMCFATLPVGFLPILGEFWSIPVPETSACSLLRNCFTIVRDTAPFEFTVTPIANAPANDRSIREHVRDLNNAILLFLKLVPPAVFSIVKLTYRMHLQ